VSDHKTINEAWRLFDESLDGTDEAVQEARLDTVTMAMGCEYNDSQLLSRFKAALDACMERKITANIAYDVMEHVVLRVSMERIKKLCKACNEDEVDDEPEAEFDPSKMN